MLEMNDTEFLRMVGQLYEYALSRENDDDYILNMPQYLKLVEAQAFFTRLAEANDGTVETVRLSPRERCAGLEAQFLVLDLKPGDLPGFFRVLQYSTGLCLAAKTTGEVCMSMTIPDVFIKRSEASLPVAEFDEGELDEGEFDNGEF